MPIRRFALVVALVTVSLTAFSGQAAACSCMPSGPPCEAFFQVDAAFVGTVRAIDIRKQPIDGIADRLFDMRVVRIAVDRAGRGVQAGLVDIWTGVGGGDCGFDFKIGERYVVYARRRPDGALTTGICSRTRLLSEAAEDVAYFEALPASPSAGVVSGTVVSYGPREPDAPVKRTPVADVQVLLRGTAAVFSAMTDTDGHYAIARVPPGAYEFEVLPPSGFSRHFLGGRVELKDPRACFVQDFGLRYDGRVSGTLVDASGKPVAGVRVDIAPAERPDDYLHDSRATSDESGHFELLDVSPGRYVVGIGLTEYVDDETVYPRTLYAAPADVGAGSRIELGALSVPEPRRRYELTGVVVDVSGAPLAGANLVIRGPRLQQLSDVVRTGADGRFAIPVFDGLAITLHGWYGVSPVGQVSGDQRLTISGPPSPVRLVLVVR